MALTPLKLVTIIAEELLESHILDDIHRLGARGHTVMQVHGRGRRSVTAGVWEVQVRIETLVAPEVAERILLHLSEHYFPDYSVIAYVQDAEVVRREKYL